MGSEMCIRDRKNFILRLIKSHFPNSSLCLSHFVSIQNQFFISGLAGDDIILNRVLEALYRRILQAHKDQKDFRVIIVMPLLPGFQVTVLTFFL